jgi:hypothetical protein
LALIAAGRFILYLFSQNSPISMKENIISV